MDLIDRQALLKQIDIDSDGEPGYYGDTWKFIDTIKNLPSATEHGTNLAEVGTDLIRRQAVLDALNNIEIPRNASWYQYYQHALTAVDKLPSAEPKRGKWIYHIDDLFPAESTMECNQCHAEQPLTCDDEFCPHCGADMRGVTT